jgi:hypothetical protein
MSWTTTTRYVGLIIVLSGLCFQGRSEAQVNPQQQAALQAAMRQPRRPMAQAPGQAAPRKTAPKEFAGVSIDRDVALPNVPGYTGKQAFMTGMQYPHNIGGPGYFVIYNTEHTQAQVREWWGNALANDPWVITSKDTRSLTAKARDGSTVSVGVSERQYSPDTNKVRGMNASYTIYYSPPPPKQRPQ